GPRPDDTRVRDRSVARDRQRDTARLFRLSLRRPAALDCRRRDRRGVRRGGTPGVSRISGIGSESGDAALRLWSRRQGARRLWRTGAAGSHRASCGNEGVGARQPAVPAPRRARRGAAPADDFSAAAAEGRRQNRRSEPLAPAAREPAALSVRSGERGAARAGAPPERRVRRGPLPAAALRALAGVRTGHRGFRRRDPRPPAAAVLGRRSGENSARVRCRRGIVSDQSRRRRRGARVLMRRVLHVVGRFLQRSETFVYTIVTHHANYEASVLCQSRLYADEFPSSRIYVCPKPLSRRRVAWWVDASVERATGRSPWRRAVEAVLADNVPDLVHAHFGPTACELADITDAAGMPLVTSLYGV